MIEDAEIIGATYFYMDETYDGNYGEWEIREKFLEQNLGKTFYVDTNPSKVTDPMLKKQIIWLQDHGYVFKNDSIGHWTAVKP